MAKVYLALPCGSNVYAGLLWTVMNASRNHKIMPRMVGSSLANLNFNRLWAEALNKRQEWGHTYFAMAHSDIKAEDGWIDTMIDLMTRHAADVMTAIIPLKSEHGLTSTGIMDQEDGRTRRFTMTEAMGMPETFSIRDTLLPKAVLAVNNGLFVCRFDQLWIEELTGFGCDDSIVLGEDGVYRAHTVGEDWRWAKWLSTQRVGGCHPGSRPLKVMATRKVKVWHHGSSDYDNLSGWGTWETDMEAGALDGGHEVDQPQSG